MSDFSFLSDDENTSCTSKWDRGESSSSGNNPLRHNTNLMTDMSNRGSLDFNSNQQRAKDSNNFFEAWLPHNLYKSRISSTHSENHNNDNASGSTSRVGPRNISSSSGPIISENSATDLVNTNPDHPARTSNVAREQIDWSFNNTNNVNDPEIFVSSRSDHSLRAGLSSGGPSSSFPLLPHEMLTLSESDSFALRRFGSSSSNATGTINQARRDRDVPGGVFNDRDVSSAVEGRNRLMHQVLNALPMDVYFGVEDYLLIDPLNEFVELRDRHRDMRVDVDNMSYEELLALEEIIGNVTNELSDEKIRSFIKQSKCEAIGASTDLEPCCICQEDYVAGDDIGKLDCGHEFHFCCIIQWLILKNICPICKTTAISRNSTD